MGLGQSSEQIKRVIAQIDREPTVTMYHRRAAAAAPVSSQPL